MNISFFMIHGQPVARTDRHILSGVVTLNGEPVRRDIIAVNRESISYIAATASNPVDGTWIISGVAEMPLESILVLAKDNTGEFDTKLIDYLSQVASI